ncbi:MAG: nicotinate-nucleotide--dimethylbenzimidazole phosphoribosyltransferase [Pseudomonadota bacterium]
MLESLSIPGIDPELGKQVQNAIDTKTKPPGSLGRMERLALQMALAQNTPSPSADPAHLLIFAGDHGLVGDGVSAWPQEVTAQMVQNFLGGGAAANVFARTNQVDLSVFDAGVAGDLADHPSLTRVGIRKGTRSALRGDALTAEEVAQALSFGVAGADAAIDGGARVIALGEMGIGNTSSASLLAHAVDGIDLSVLAGPGAGLDAQGVARKLAILEDCAARRSGRLDPLDALAAFGGLEICAMAGAAIGAAARRAIVLVDGFIASASALIVLRARPEIRPFICFAHRSHEPGHRVILESLDADPLLDLELRLGEGTGALLAVPLLRASCAMLAEMATFESAGVSEKD